jgi:protein TonB
LLEAAPFGSEMAFSSPSSSKKITMVIAACTLLAAGAAGGGFWYYRQRLAMPETLALPQIATAPPAPAELLSSSDFTSPGSGDLQPMASSPVVLPAPQTDIVIEPGPSEPRAAQPARPAQQAAAAPLARALPPAARRRNLEVGKLPAPVPRNLPSPSFEAEAPPMIVAAPVDLGIANGENALLAGRGTDAAPPKPRPSVGGQLESPKLVSSTPPAYPQSARSQRVQGVVVLDALVDENGRVAETTVITGPPALQTAAQAAVRSWRYQPARLNGEPISVHIKVSVRFSLN